MRSRLALVLTVMLVAMTGCTTIPTRFTQDPTISESGGYRIEEETSHGLGIRVRRDTLRSQLLRAMI